MQVAFERAAWTVAAHHPWSGLATRAVRDALEARAPRTQATLDALRLDAFEERWRAGDLGGEVKRALVRLRDDLQRELRKNR
jgi:hypothetical protein